MKWKHSGILLCAESVLISISTLNEWGQNKWPRWGSDHCWAYFCWFNGIWKWEAIITNFNVTIVTLWPFVSRGLGTLVKAGVVKVTQAFIFLSVWKEDLCSLWPLRKELCVLTLLCYFFSPCFSCIRVSDCPGTVTQSALLTQERAFTGLCDFCGNYNLKYSVWTLKSCWQLSLMGFSRK